MLPRRPSQIMATIMAICCERHWKVIVTWEMEKVNLPRDPGKISPSLSLPRALARPYGRAALTRVGFICGRGTGGRA
eukprot:1175235-Prymnesium_polylepis.1